MVTRETSRLIRCLIQCKERLKVICICSQGIASFSDAKTLPVQEAVQIFYSA